MRTEELVTALNAFSTTTLSDALDGLGINGGCERLVPQVPGSRCTGRAFTVKFEPVGPGELAAAADYVDEAEEGSVIVLDNGGITYCTVWGDILSMYAQRHGIAGTVINGLCRDISESRAMGYPLFSLGAYMKSGKNRVRMKAHSVPVTVGATTIHPGDFVTADDNGVLAIPAANAQFVLERARQITEMEELVRDAVKNGTPLAKARQMHGYNTPLAKKAV